jgi:predicted transcriptional regulator
MGAGTTGRVALMAIQPQYSQAILAGEKTVEFRKRALAPDVDTVLIYETAPTQQVVGIFKVDDTVRLAPSSLWRRFGSVGSITRPDFMNYYDTNRTAVGLVVGTVVRLAVPVSLSELRPRPAVPQSFSYLPAAVLDQIDAIQALRPIETSTLLPA